MLARQLEEGVPPFAFVRSRRHGFELIDEFLDGGISGTRELEDRPGLAAVLDRLENNGVTALGRFVEIVLAGVNQLDNEVKAERTVSSMQEALRRGRYRS